MSVIDATLPITYTHRLPRSRQVRLRCCGPGPAIGLPARHHHAFATVWQHLAAGYGRKPCRERPGVSSFPCHLRRNLRRHYPSIPLTIPVICLCRPCGLPPSFLWTASASLVVCLRLPCEMFICAPLHRVDSALRAPLLLDNPTTLSADPSHCVAATHRPSWAAVVTITTGPPSLFWVHTPLPLTRGKANTSISHISCIVCRRLQFFMLRMHVVYFLCHDLSLSARLVALHR